MTTATKKRPAAKNGKVKPTKARKKRPATASTVSTETAQQRATENELATIALGDLVDHPDNPEPTEAEVLQMTQWLLDDGQQESLTVRVIDHPTKAKLAYEVLAGKTRLAAARRLGWKSLECRVRTDLNGDLEAVKFVGASNAQRRTETPLRQATMLNNMIERGVSAEDAGKIYGLTSRAGVQNKLAILRVGPYFQKLLAEGELAESAVRSIAPYADHAPLMKAFEKDHKQNAAYEWQSRDEVARTVTYIVNEETRPIDKKIKHHYGYQLGGEHRRYFELDDATRAKLDIVEIQVGKSKQERALNVKAYDKLQLPLIRERLKEKGSKSKKAASGKKLTPAQQAKADATKEKAATAKKLRRWRHLFLRQQIAKRISLTKLAGPLCMWTMAHAKEQPYRHLGEDLISFERDVYRMAGVEQVHEARTRVADHVSTLATVESAYLQMMASYLLWPSCSANPDDELADGLECVTAGIPETLPHYDDEDIESLAKQCDVDLVAAWEFAAKADGCFERLLVEQYFQHHTKGQLQALVDELGKPAWKGDPIKAIVRDGAKAAIIESLMQWHSGDGLPYPKELAALEPKPKRATPKKRKAA